MRWTPSFGQKNGLIKVEPLFCCVGRFTSVVVENPLSWAGPKSCSTPAGEAEAGNAGEQPVKE
jgi:hypothetical protein